MLWHTWSALGKTVVVPPTCTHWHNSRSELPDWYTNMTITKGSLTLVSKPAFLILTFYPTDNEELFWNSHKNTKEVHTTRLATLPNTQVDGETKPPLFFNVNSAKVRSCPGPTTAGEYCSQDALFVILRATYPSVYIRIPSINILWPAFTLLYVWPHRADSHVIDLIFYSRDVSHTASTINRPLCSWWME